MFTRFTLTLLSLTWLWNSRIEVSFSVMEGNWFVHIPYRKIKLLVIKLIVIQRNTKNQGYCVHMHALRFKQMQNDLRDPCTWFHS